MREETRVATLRPPLPAHAQHAAPSLARSTASAAARDEAALRQRRATTSHARLMRVRLRVRMNKGRGEGGDWGSG